jgi:hypothetical protein
MDFEEEDLFYDNPELVLSNNKDEEEGQEKVEVQEGSRRQYTVIDQNSIKYIFCEETRSQSTNELHMEHHLLVILLV